MAARKTSSKKSLADKIKEIAAAHPEWTEEAVKAAATKWNKKRQYKANYVAKAKKTTTRKSVARGKVAHSTSNGAPVHKALQGLVAEQARLELQLSGIKSAIVTAQQALRG